MEEIQFEDFSSGVNTANIRSYYFYYDDGNCYIELYYNNGSSMKQLIKNGYEKEVKQAFFESLEYSVNKNNAFINFFKDGNKGIYDVKTNTSKKLKSSKK